MLSAVEGLGVAAPGLQDYVIPLTLLVLTALFAVQRFGTGGIGRAFGPITLVWFVTLVALGLPHIAAHPGVNRVEPLDCAVGGGAVAKHQVHRRADRAVQPPPRVLLEARVMGHALRDERMSDLEQQRGRTGAEQHRLAIDPPHH